MWAIRYRNYNGKTSAFAFPVKMLAVDNQVVVYMLDGKKMNLGYRDTFRLVDAQTATAEDLALMSEWIDLSSGGGW